MSGRVIGGTIAALLLVAGAGVGAWNWKRARAPAEVIVPELAEVERSERLLLAVTPRLKPLAGAMLDMRLPDHGARELFGPSVSVVDLSSSVTDEGADLPSIALDGVNWQMTTSPQDVARGELRLWRPLIDELDYFEWAKFKVVRGAFPGGARREWTAQLVFAATARDTTGAVVAMEGHVDTVWEFDGDDDAAETDIESWRIVSWHTTDLHSLRAPRRLFADVIDRVLPDPADREEARHSVHEELIAEFLSTGSVNGRTSMSVVTGGYHPSVVAADIDNDGDDDLFVVRRHEPLLLYRNRGDGTFEEAAADFGLDFRARASCALLLDLDNDGDLDLFLGGFHERARVLLNNAGRFEPPADPDANSTFPARVTSLAAADFDGDGLLDVYASTYNHVTAAVGDPQLTTEKAERLAKYFSRDEIEKMKALSGGPEAIRVRNLFGPPNSLWRNTGGGTFERVESDVLTQYRHTYQSSWSDYDLDGDPDLYVASDFAPNNLLRNNGDGTFTDVTAETNTADIGFGMGAAWGDYDFDGRPDLYISNMYSKAGRRITSGLTGLVDESLAKYARGNSLLRNTPDGFVTVSALEEPGLLVERAGWSWSGQFQDFDNDGDLDVHALSGYYTAPSIVEVPEDR